MSSIFDRNASRGRRGGLRRVLVGVRAAVIIFVIIWPALAAACMAALRRLRRPTRRGVALTLCVPAALCVLYVLVLIPFTPSIGDIRKAHLDEPARVLSADGKLLAEFRPGNRAWVKLADISPYMVDALISTEDHRFYRHHGLDGWRIASAVLHTFSGARQGGSTLTQQLARNLYPDEIGRAPTLTRKLKEAITALKIESVYNKNEILETYLNTVPFLYDAYGVEMAARTYFNKSASELNILESATLVGMLKGNSYYNPVLNPERALQRRNIVLAQMVKYGRLSQADYDVLKNRPLGVDFARQTEPPGPAPHFAQQVRQWLSAWADRNGYNIYTDGLVVYTTIDSRLQTMATQSLIAQTRQLQTSANAGWNARGGCALDNDLLKTFMRETPEYRVALKQIGQAGQTGQTGQTAQARNARTARADASDKENPRAKRHENARHFAQRGARQNARQGAPQNARAVDADALQQLAANRAFMHTLCDGKTDVQAGFLAIDPRDGGIRAWVGSPDFASEPFDHVQQARRQPGSTFKAFVYGAAFANGMKPDDTYTDQAVNIALAGGGAWQPTDGAPPSGRAVTLRDALTYSRNRITAQLMVSVGPQRVVRLSRALGVRDSALDAVPSLALGTSPVTLKEMVSAYSTIADGGEYHEPRMVTRIEDRNGRVLATFAPGEAQRALSKDAANTLIDVLRDVVDRGTGASIRTRFGIRADVAGKTGTTQDNTDGWFILMDPQLVAGAWVGFDDTRVTPGSVFWGEGARSALPIVGNFFHRALRAKIVDPRARFAAAPQSHPGFFGRIIAKLRRWFGALFHRGSTQPATSTPGAGSVPSSSGAARSPRASGGQASGPFKPGAASAASGTTTRAGVSASGMVGASGLRPASAGGVGAVGPTGSFGGVMLPVPPGTSGAPGKPGGTASPTRTAPGANVPMTGNAPALPGGAAAPGRAMPGATAPMTGNATPPGGVAAPGRTAPGGTVPPFSPGMGNLAHAVGSSSGGAAPPRTAPTTTQDVPPLLDTGANPAGANSAGGTQYRAPGDTSPNPGAPSSYAPPPPSVSAPVPPPAPPGVPSGNAADPFGNAQGGNTSSGGLSN